MLDIFFYTYKPLEKMGHYQLFILHIVVNFSRLLREYYK